MGHQETSDKGKKRKKKRSQMQMAKKFARQRDHGTELDQDTYQYMVRILGLMNEGFPSLEEKLIFVNNVYEQTAGHEIEYAKNQIGSRILDSLLQYASLEVIQRLVNAFGESLRQLSGDRFASHVLQRIISVCADRGNRQQQSKADGNKDIVVEVKDSDVNCYNDIVLKLSRYFINNIEEFVFDTYANHLLRTVVQSLGGLIDVSDNRKKFQSTERRSVTQEYKDLLVTGCNRLYKWPQFLEFGREELTSGLLQSILHSLKDIDEELTKSIIKRITKGCFEPGDEQKISNIFDSESSVRVLEACLSVSQPKTFKSIYKKFFAGHLETLSLTQSTNFSVQKLLDHCATKELFEEIFDEMSEHFSKILDKRHTGVLSSMANACVRLQARQHAFMNAIFKLLQCDASPERQLQIVICTCTLKTADEIEALKKEKIQNPQLNLHGSLMIQAMLNFNKPIRIVTSLLEMEKEELLYLFSDPKGSRIVDAYVESKYVGEKSREKLGKKLQGCWAQLAQSTHGSRCLDKIWECSRMNQKLRIMEELAAAGESLRSSKSGIIITSKLNVALFARNKKEWTESQGKQEKTRALFADVIAKPIKQ